MKHKWHCHLMLDVLNKLPVIKILNMKSLKTIVSFSMTSYSIFWSLTAYSPHPASNGSSFENMVEIVSLRQMLNVLWKCALEDDRDGKIICSNWTLVSFKRTQKYTLFYSSVIVLKISREFFAIAAVRDPSVLDIAYRVWVAKDPNM